MRQRARAAAIVPVEGRVLLVHGVDLRSHPWQPPGGGVEGAESLEQCAVREVEEETGLIIAPLRLVYVRQLIQHRQCITHMEFFFLADVTGGCLRGDNTEGDDSITHAGFVGRDELAGIEVWPRALAARLWDDLAAGFPTLVDLGAHLVQTR